MKNLYKFIFNKYIFHKHKLRCTSTQKPEPKYYENKRETQSLLRRSDCFHGRRRCRKARERITLACEKEARELVELGMVENSEWRGFTLKKKTEMRESWFIYLLYIE